MSSQGLLFEKCRRVCSSVDSGNKEQCKAAIRFLSLARKNELSFPFYVHCLDILRNKGFYIDFGKQVRKDNLRVNGMLSAICPLP